MTYCICKTNIYFTVIFQFKDQLMHYALKVIICTNSTKTIWTHQFDIDDPRETSLLEGSGNLFEFTFRERQKVRASHHPYCRGVGGRLSYLLPANRKALGSLLAGHRMSIVTSEKLKSVRLHANRKNQRAIKQQNPLFV